MPAIGMRGRAPALDGDRASIRATRGRAADVTAEAPVTGVADSALASAAGAPSSASTARASASESSTERRRSRREATSTVEAMKSGLSRATITAVTALAASTRSTTSPPRKARACHRARANARVRAPGVGGTSSTCHGRCCTATPRRRTCWRERGSACCAGIGRGGVARRGVTAVAAGIPAAVMTTPVYRGVGRCIAMVSGSRRAGRPHAAAAPPSRPGWAASRYDRSPRLPPEPGQPGW